MGIKWNDGQFKRKLSELNPKTYAAVAEGVEDAGDLVIELAQELAPYDTGELHDSDFRTKAEDINGAIGVDLGFEAEHAAEVHEDPDQPRRKYLQEAFELSEQEMGDAIVDSIKRHFGGG